MTNLNTDLRFEIELIKLDEVVKSQQNDGFDVGASCGRPCPGERSSPLSRVSRDNDEVEAQSRSERDRWTLYEIIRLPSRLNHSDRLSLSS